MDNPTPYREGDQSIFKILGSKVFPDKKEYLILQGQNGQRCLIDANPYHSYGLEPGGEVLCRIDKINCNGKIFPEPLHPLYKPGYYYDFAVVSTLTLPNVSIAVVRDGLGKTYNILLKAGLKPEGNVKCRVVCIRKGKLYLDPVSAYPRRKNYDNGTIRQLTCTAFATLAENTGYCIATNHEGDVFLFPSAYADDRRLAPGDKADCVIYLEKCGHEDVQLLLKGYTPGEAVQVSYLGHEIQPDVLKGPKQFIHCTGIMGERTDILANGLRIPPIRPGTPLQCIIRRYRNGRPVLETTQEALNQAARNS